MTTTETIRKKKVKKVVEEEVEEEDTAPSDIVVMRAKWDKRILKEGEKYQDVEEDEFQFYVKFLDDSAPEGYVAAKSVFADDYHEQVKEFIRKNRRHANACLAFSDDPEFSELRTQHIADTLSKQSGGTCQVLKKVSIAKQFFAVVFEML